MEPPHTKRERTTVFTVLPYHRDVAQLKVALVDIHDFLLRVWWVFTFERPATAVCIRGEDLGSVPHKQHTLFDGTAGSRVKRAAEVVERS
jgi:hypothetical protein